MQKKVRLGKDESLLRFSLVRGMIIIICLICMSVNHMAQAQSNKTVTGAVTDSAGKPLSGVAVLVKGTRIGGSTGSDGRFTLTVPNNARVLVLSFVGMATKEVAIGNQSYLNVTLSEATRTLEEVVVVGYGEQKKQSVVGAIVQVSGEELKRTGGVVNAAQAMTGQLPGVTVIQGTGEPGADDPRILIRAQGTWNNSNPLILVDGVERRMNDIDMNEIETISVLKDASATAVFGVKGAEGVILITTKRGKIGKPKFSIDVNTNTKFLSRTPEKLNSYDGFMYRNRSIEYELPVTESSWGMYTPVPIVNRYRHPQAPGDEYIFPDVDWPKVQLKPLAQSHRVNLSVSGGSNTARYFTSLSYTHDGDLLNSGLDNGKGYKSKNAFDRFNFRSNLDLDITRSTIFSINLSGIVGIKYGSPGQDIWRPFYQSAPQNYPVRFPDGAWGFTNKVNIPNPLYLLNNFGTPTNTRSQVTTDFVLQQKLDFLIKGLSYRGSLSYDNLFFSSGGISDNGNAPMRYIDPDIINMKPGETENDYIYGTNQSTGINDFDWVQQPVTYLPDRSANLGGAYRRLFYQNQLRYARIIGDHDLGTTFLMNREEFAQGSMFPRYREDWVGRVTYSYDDRYLFESNAAYNGSEKFSREYRFGFFPSVALGWRASNEKIFKKADWLSNLKFRYSIGKVGNDNFNAPRWAYATQWAIDGERTNFGAPNNAPSPYVQYTEEVIGNPNLQWETAVKQNFGIEAAVFKNRIRFTADFFQDHRENIFMSAGQRRISNYFGAQPVAANLGETKSKGYELSLFMENTFPGKLHVWVNTNYTYAKDETIFREDPVLLPSYQKQEGFQIGQTRSSLTAGYVNNWDEVFSNPALPAGNGLKLPGDYRMVDFNGDGKIDNFDTAPYAYPTRPQNTYNFSFGFDYKGFSVMAQFYGVYNVSRRYGWFMYPYSDASEFVIFENMFDTWNKDNTDAPWPAQRTNRTLGNNPEGDRYLVDGSFLRLKTAEISYTIGSKIMKRIGATSSRIYLNGNNLLYWSQMMDDSEADGLTNGAGYPTYKRINLGLNVNF